MFLKLLIYFFTVCLLAKLSSLLQEYQGLKKTELHQQQHEQRQVQQQQQQLLLHSEHGFEARLQIFLCFLSLNGVKRGNHECEDFFH